MGIVLSLGGQAVRGGFLTHSTKFWNSFPARLKKRGQKKASFHVHSADDKGWRCLQQRGDKHNDASCLSKSCAPKWHKACTVIELEN